jgi:hypothetical protein
LGYLLNLLFLLIEKKLIHGAGRHEHQAVVWRGAAGATGVAPVSRSALWRRLPLRCSRTRAAAMPLAAALNAPLPHGFSPSGPSAPDFPLPSALSPRHSRPPRIPPTAQDRDRVLHRRNDLGAMAKP